MHALIFVYGTLRLSFGGEMAQRLHGGARHVGRAQAKGQLYRIAEYPGFVPGEGQVTGDLFLLDNPARMLALLDDYEECAARFPLPHEYVRQLLTVQAVDGPVDAWTYIYLRDVEGLPLIDSGDFLA
ncbi:gamma-glutamylcyclotransferase family protein [Sphingobium sp.]|uniref:gamma-glutamylcyclotransferase family protein n=1 Tax=Sphingobium sp. TaxID=1912891 RepID=UPI003BB6E043